MSSRLLLHKMWPLQWLLYGCFFWLTIASVHASMSSISAFTQDMEQQQGYYDFFYDPSQDKVFLQVPLEPSPFIFQSSLPRGIGSNDLGLDRGQLGKTRLAEFRVHGPRVLLTEKNTRYLALTDNEAERKSVQEAFAESVLFGFDVVARDQQAVLIDYTPFLYTDIHQIQARLKQLNEGDFKPDVSRSALWPDRMKSFPRNTELEARVTFVGSGAGQYVRSVTPEPTAITVHLHHSLIQLPDDEYQPRAFHPNSGYYANGFQNYAAPLQSSMAHRFINRHRLEKKDPTAELSEPVQPIVYYLDPGVPEPVRTALLDGARWWNDAFTAIGYKDAFIVKDLPADADPMDVRYNIIQWVHRATRGWSYGYSVADPRTGEILKGHVSLGSLRVRQDMLIAQGLLAPFADGKDSTRLLADIETMALNRIRQLSAHEIGHTLGIAHNFAANAQNRTSVMDYPHPLVSMNDEGEIHLNQAYSSGMGSWDKFAVAYGYSEFASKEQEQAGLTALLQQARQQNYDFISDRDARPIGGAHPTAHLWDNGADAEVELQRLITVRQKVLAEFGLNNLADGQPLDQLEHLLVPMYLLHRFQAEAAVKLIGGMHYRYYVKGEGDSNYRPVEASRQNAALSALLQTLNTDFLQLPAQVQQLLVPKAYGSANSREDFQSRMGLIQDPITMAEASAQHSLQLILHPERLNRLRWQHQQDNVIPSPRILAAKLSESTLHPLRSQDDAISQRVAYLALLQLAMVSRDSNTAPEVRAQLEAQLQENAAWLQRHSRRATDSDYFSYLNKRIEHFLTQGEWLDDFTPVQMPPGSPI
ncbi:zinc-dependent metalloprotease [Alkalimonas collagenimarina]|uniref:Zinc-dependent metalloprotease n=1 Tax=Alkalimonas collagenimarina TaxID=400390 RepID=A0ABT9H0N7_9GAMM|nr:zinc-dependent metalloprotease [Alkalimonas collagenimarina]MDP4536877.1 zinc-dependent metalloprotease [Alkalimonas collagenimarina]